MIIYFHNIYMYIYIQVFVCGCVLNICNIEPSRRMYVPWKNQSRVKRCASSQQSIQLKNWCLRVDYSMPCGSTYSLREYFHRIRRDGIGARILSAGPGLSLQILAQMGHWNCWKIINMIDVQANLFGLPME